MSRVAATASLLLLHALVTGLRIEQTVLLQIWKHAGVSYVRVGCSVCGCVSCLLKCLMEKAASLQ